MASLKDSTIYHHYYSLFPARIRKNNDYMDTCNICDNLGRIPCTTCSQRGSYNGCSVCNGTGKSFGEACTTCAGEGRYKDINSFIPVEMIVDITCVDCIGKGYHPCPTNCTYRVVNRRSKQQSSGQVGGQVTRKSSEEKEGEQSSQGAK
jgi:DnaJ-class molecular chaperone